MGILGPVLYVMYAVGTAPGADIPLTVFVGLAIVIMIGFVYWMFSTSMPRTGGDYIWVSRVLHPFVGFLESTMILFVMITSFVSYDIYLAVTNGLSYVFINYGYLANDNGLVNFGVQLASDKPTILIASILISILVVCIMLLPIKRVVNVLVGTFFVTVAIYIVYIALLLSTGNAGFIANFNAHSGTTYDAVINSLGTSPYTLGGTLFIGLVFVMLSYIGLVNSSYFAGEVSGNPFKAQGLAIFGSPLIYGVFLFGLYFVQFSVYGHDFLAASVAAYFPTYSWLGIAGGMSQPSGVFLVNFLTTSPWLSALVAFGVALQFVMWAMAFYLAPTRYIFSWSFDRILPLGLSKTSKKGVPYYAVLLYGLVTIVFVVLAVYTSILSFYAYAIFGFYFSTTIVLIAGALFPFRRKEIFEASHRYVKARVAGIPVITIVGIVGAIFTFITMVVTVLPAYTGFPIRIDYFAPIIIMLLFSTFLYFGSYFYQKSHGLPVELIGKEIPPL